MTRITPFLWFDTQAEEAANFYVSVFSNRPGAEPGESKILDVSRYGDAGPRPAGMVMTVSYRLGGQDFVGLNGGPEFSFDESVSFLVDCDSQAEVDYFWDALLADGGKESMCGWLSDRFGLSWQVVPRQLNELLSDPDPETSQRVMKAMLQMVKIDVAELQRAHDAA
jgi:predicted 3-demethylubiquinone-9 3-methyltransferase (glyoxalase superfamily)